LLRQHDGALADGMLDADGEHTSYTIVLSPPGVDRFFLHHTGANSTFCAGDVPLDRLDGARFFHFGYPPLMRRMYLEGGAEMAALLRQVKERGLFTSLDMAKPDVASEGGQVDWPAWLARVLPLVDLFAPSLDEMLLMVGRTEEGEDPSLYGALAGELLQMGAAMVALKLGDRGLYLRTTRDAGRLSPWVSAAWVGRELLAPCFEVEVVGTTGAGDCTLAGLLVGLSQGASPEETVTLATAVGAFSVERADSTSGVPSLEAVRRRIASGWPRRSRPRLPDGWARDDEYAVYQGPGSTKG
jgi:sugar/nucleoside kinase (ribokinase family)